MVNIEASKMMMTVKAALGSLWIFDTAGNIIYKSRENSAELPEKTEAAFAAHEDRFYYRDEGIIFGTEAENIPTEQKAAAAEIFLKLAAEIYETEVRSAEARLNEQLKNMLIGTDKTPEPEAEQLFERIAEKSSKIILLLVKKSGKSGGKCFDTELVELIKEIFSEEREEITVIIDPATAAVIIPLSQGLSTAEVESKGEMLKLAAATELILDINVSLSGIYSVTKPVVAYRAAARAMEIGLKFELKDKCFSFDRLGLARLFYQMDESTCNGYLVEIFGENFVSEHRRKYEQGERDELVKTVSTYLSCNQNIGDAAKELIIHRNTLTYRLEKFNKMTGLDCMSFEDGVKIRVGFMVMKHLGIM